MNISKTSVKSTTVFGYPIMTLTLEYVNQSIEVVRVVGEDFYRCSARCEFERTCIFMKGRHIKGFLPEPNNSLSHQENPVCYCLPQEELDKYLLIHEL